jgi:hypothetical protein
MAELERFGFVIDTRLPGDWSSRRKLKKLRTQQLRDGGEANIEERLMRAELRHNL